MKQNNRTYHRFLRLFIATLSVGFVASCEFRPELPEAGSIPDLTPPAASFEHIPTPENFRILRLTNTSVEATNYRWDFGSNGVECEEVDGEIVCGTFNTTTEIDTYVKFDAEDGDLVTVSLTALDDNEASNTATVEIQLVDEFVPLPVTVLNGDFEDGRDNWTISNWDTWENSAFETSGDGSPNLYDGSPSGGTRTGGAKWNASRSVGTLANSGTRVAYQALVVSPSVPAADRFVKYQLRFEYAIKDDIATDPPEGRIVIADVIAGHYDDGDEAYAQTDPSGPNSLLQMVESERKGKGNFTEVTGEFTAPESGLISILFSAITPVDVYVDNVHVEPVN